MYSSQASSPKNSHSITQPSSSTPPIVHLLMVSVEAFSIRSSTSKSKLCREKKRSILRDKVFLFQLAWHLLIGSAIIECTMIRSRLVRKMRLLLGNTPCERIIVCLDTATLPCAGRNIHSCSSMIVPLIVAVSIRLSKDSNQGFVASAVCQEIIHRKVTSVTPNVHVNVQPQVGSWVLNNNTFALDLHRCIRRSGTKSNVLGYPVHIQLHWALTNHCRKLAVLILAQRNLNNREPERAVLVNNHSGGNSRPLWMVRNDLSSCLDLEVSRKTLQERELSLEKIRKGDGLAKETRTCIRYDPESNSP